MAMSTTSVNKAFAGKAFTSTQKPSSRARVSRSALVCKASQDNKSNVVLKAAGAALGALAAVQLGLAGPAAADVSFDSSRSGGPPQNKDAVNLPSSFFKTGDTLQEKLGFSEDARDQGNKVGQASFPNASQEDFKIEKTAKTAQKGLEKSFQNLNPTSETSDLPNPFDGAGGIADKACPPAPQVFTIEALKGCTQRKWNFYQTYRDLTCITATCDEHGTCLGTPLLREQGKCLMCERMDSTTSCVQAKGTAKDVGKGLNPNSSNLPNPSAAVDKAAGNLKGLAGDAKKGARNVANDLSENPLDGLADKAKGSAKDVGKGLNPNSSSLPNPSAAIDKAAGNAKGLAADAKKGAKNIASDLSENPLDGLADKAKGTAKDVGKNLNPGSSNLPDPSAAADKVAGNAKGLASDAKSAVKKEANTAGDLSDLPNPFDGPGGLAEKVKGSAKDVGKNLNPSSSNLPDPSAAADKAVGKAKDFASDSKSTLKGLKNNPNT